MTDCLQAPSKRIHKNTVVQYQTISILAWICMFTARRTSKQKSCEVEHHRQPVNIKTIKYHKTTFKKKPWNIHLKKKTCFWLQNTILLWAPVACCRTDRAARSTGTPKMDQSPASTTSASHQRTRRPQEWRSDDKGQTFASLKLCQVREASLLFKQKNTFQN